MGTFLIDMMQSVKDFVFGSVKGVANGPYSWASWVWPLTSILAIGVGLSTGNAALALGIGAGGPLLAAVAGGVVGLFTGGVGEVMHNQSERSHNRAINAKERTRSEPVPAKPAKTAAAEVPDTEITAPGVTPVRLADAGRGPARG